MNTNLCTKKFLAPLLTFSLLTSLQSCTESEVATALGVVAIGAGAVAIGVAAGANDNNERGHYRDRDRDYGRDHGRRRGRSVCEGGYVNRCSTYYDYDGYERRTCRNEWDSCARTRWEHYADSYEMMSAPVEVTARSETRSTKLEDTVVESGKWAETFKLSFESADLFTGALELARKGDTEGLRDLGLTKRDINALAREKMPSTDAIDLLARKLDQRAADTRSMIQTLLSEGSKLKKERCKTSVVRGSVSVRCG